MRKGVPVSDDVSEGSRLCNRERGEEERVFNGRSKKRIDAI